MYFICFAGNNADVVFGVEKVRIEAGLAEVKGYAGVAIGCIIGADARRAYLLYVNRIKFVWTGGEASIIEEKVIDFTRLTR